jgi:hypothetical protein
MVETKLETDEEMIILSDENGEVVAWHIQEWIDDPDIVFAIVNAAFMAGDGQDIRKKIA